MKSIKRVFKLFVRFVTIIALLFNCAIVAGTTDVEAVTGLSVTKLSDTVIDPNGLNYSADYYGYYPNEGSTPKLITFNNYQYTTYYNADRRVCIARRKLSPLSPWQVITFTDYTFSTNDTHNTTQLGICRGDGTLHLTFDHHDSNLHYKKSVLGAATNPDGVTWDASLFSAITSTLLTGVAESHITYPTFVDVPNGDMKLIMRTYGGSSNADSTIYTYRAGTHNWVDKGMFISRLGTYQGDLYRNPYINSQVTYGDDGKLYLSWMWRETTDSMSNHDLMFIYSEDHGVTWKGTAGNQVGVTGSSAMSIDTSGITVWNIPTNHGLMNDGTSYIDSNGIFHVVLSHTPTTDPDYATWSEARANSKYYHYWRGTDGVWHQAMITGVSPSGTVKLLFDKNNNAYIVYMAAGDLRIAAATVASNWSDWGGIYSDGSRNYETPSVDYVRWKNEGVLSVFVQEKPAVAGTPSAIRSIDFQAYNLQKVTRNPEADAHIADGTNAATNYGSSANFAVKNTPTVGYRRMSYLKFDFSGSSYTKVANAKISLRGYNGEDSTQIPVKIYGITNDSWTETGITWNNAPNHDPNSTTVTGAGSTAFYLGTACVYNTGQYYEWDVTKFINDQLPDKIVSFIVVDESGGNKNCLFSSKESSTNKPSLTIAY